MKATGITRQIDSAGRIVLPKELRKMLDLKENRDYLEIFTKDDCIILRKYLSACVFCNSTENVIEFGGKKVCRNCAQELFDKSKQF